MVNSDEEDFLITITHPFVKIELEQFEDSDDDDFLEPLSPIYNPIPTEEAHLELYDQVSDREDSGSDWEKETKPQVKTCKAKQPPNNKKSKKGKTHKKSKDSSREPPRQKKSTEQVAKKRERWPEEKRRAREKVKVKKEVVSGDEEETPKIPESKWRRKRASEMTPEELEAKRIKWREESRQKRERKRLSQGEVAKHTEKVGLEGDSEDNGDAQKVKVKSKSTNSRRRPRSNVSKLEGTFSEKITVNGVYRRKRVDEMTPEEHAALKVKWREEARLKREKRRETQGVEPTSERERSLKRQKRDCEEFRTKEAAARRLQRARMTEAEVEERRRKDRERRRDKRRLCGRTEADIQARRRYHQRRKETMTPEQKAEERQRAAMRRIMKLASMTEEELAERRQRLYMQNVARFSRMTREELEEFKQKKKDKQREMVAQRTPEEIQKIKEKNRERYRNMTSEQREKFYANREKYKKRRLDNLRQDPERMNNIRAKVNATNERKGRGPEPGDGPKRKGRPRLPIEVVKERKRLSDKKSRLKRKLMIQDLLDSGMSMEEIMEKLETPEQRNRRLIRSRIAAAKRKLRKQLSEMGAPPEQIAAKVNELVESYEPSQEMVYKPRPSRFKRVDRSKLDELLEMKSDPLMPDQTEPSPPPSTANSDVDYDNAGSGGDHEDDYSSNSSPPPPPEETKVSYQPQPAASYPYPHPHSQNNWEGASTSSTYATRSASIYQHQPPPVVFRGNQNPPQPPPPPPPKEYQDNWATPQEPGSSSDSDNGGDNNHPTSRRRTGAGRKDYGPRGGFRATLERKKKLAACDECGHIYSERYMFEHKNHFHNKNFVDGKCVLCGESFLTGKLFYKHFLVDHEKVTVNRKRCRGSRLPNHYKGMTEDELDKWRQTLVVCDLCGNSYTREQISSHKKLNHHPNYVGGKCTICNAPVLNSRSYFIHFRKEHNNEENTARKSRSKFVCEVCGKGFRENHFLAQHFHYNHGDGAKEENFSKCPICEKMFKYKHVMEHHVQKYHPSEVENVIRHHECRHCHQTFRYQIKLGEHISTQHPESYFPCPHCNSFRTSKQNLYFHFFVCKKTPKGFVKELGDKNIVSLEKTPLKCEVCEKDVTVYSLKRHYREVHGVEEDLYPCGECPKMFKIRQFWVNHMDEAHGILFDDELKEKVRKMHVLDKTMLEIKEGERCGKEKKSGRSKKNKGEPKSRRRKVRFQKFVKVFSEEEELSDKEDSSEDEEDVEIEALERMSRVGTRSRPRIKRELQNVEEEKILVISVVRMSEDEIREAVSKKGGSTIPEPSQLPQDDSLM